MDLTHNFSPYEPQILLYNFIDYGYDIINSHFKPSSPVSIIVMKWPRQRGKTEGCGAAAAALALMHPNETIGIISANEDAAIEFTTRAVRYIENSPFSKAISRQRSDRIELRNGSVIFSMTNSEKSIRGRSITWLFIDEAAILEDEVIESWGIHTVSMKGAFNRWKTPHVILLSTPQGEKGKFIEYYYKGLSYREIGCLGCGARRSVNDADFKFVRFDPLTIPELPPCPKCGHKKFEYIHNKIATLELDPWKHPTKTVEEIQDEIDRGGNTPIIRQEILGEILSDRSGVFPRVWLEGCVDQELFNDFHPEEGKQYVIGGDFGKIHDATVFTIGHMWENKVIVDYIDYMPAVGGMEYTDIRHRLLSLINTFRPSMLVLDATGLGNPIVEQIEHDIRDLQTIGVCGKYQRNGGDIQYDFAPNRKIFTKVYSNKKNQLGFIIDYGSKKDLVDNLSNLFQRHLIAIPSEYVHESVKILWKELISFGYDYTQNKRIVYGTQRSHDDTVISLALMAWGCRQSPFYYVAPRLGDVHTLVL
jgi:hypothetical protein